MSDGLGVKEMKLLGGAGALFTSGRRRFAYGWAPIAVWDVGHGKRPWRMGTQGYDEPFRSPRCWQTSRGASKKLGQLRQPETCAVCILLAKVLTHKAYSWNLPPIASTDSIFKSSAAGVVLLETSLGRASSQRCVGAWGLSAFGKSL